MEEPTQVSQLLGRLCSGDNSVQAELLPLVYTELHRVAARFMSRERPDHTLQPTALVHEAYLRLVGQPGDWRDRAHFFGVAATMMRHILIDHARQHNAAKRGAGHKIRWDDGFLSLDPDFGAYDELDQALDRLAAQDQRAAKVVEMRFFVGHTEEEIGLLLDIHPRTVKRDWSFAKRWLRSQLEVQSAAADGAEA